MRHHGNRRVRAGARTARRRRPVWAITAVLTVALAGCAWPAAEPGVADPGIPVAQASPTPTVEPTPTPTDDPTPTPTETPTPSPEPTPTETPTPSPEPTPTPSETAPPAEPTPTPSPEPTPTEPPAPQYPQRGSTGPEVQAIQQRLIDLGYFLWEADGDYGWATQQAVWAFQKAAGLGRDGVIGPRTQDALDAGHRPTPRSSSGKVVEIDIDRQILLAVEDGHVVRIINASSGNGETFEAKGHTYQARTPRGDFAVYMQDNGMHSSTLELGDMWRPQYFTGGIAVHGSPSIPPYPASHGCVRVSNAAMDWLWDSWGMSIGTPVLVY